MVSRLKWNKWITNSILLHQDKTEQDCTALSKVPNVVKLKKKRKNQHLLQKCSKGLQLRSLAVQRSL